MKNMFKEKLNKKQTRIIRFFLAIFLPILLIVTGGTYVLYRVQANADRTILENYELEEVDVQKKLITNQLDTVASDLDYMVSQPMLLRFLESDPDERWRELLEELYLAFISRKRVYDQVRFLDEKGMEIVRVNYAGGLPYIVPDKMLQDKSGRYYFQEAIRLNRREMYVSPFDLNVERGQIEQPYIPMIRLSSPVFDESGEKRGIVVLNYLGDNLLRRLRTHSSRHMSQFMLLNSAGYWLYSPNQEDEWGFMFADRKERTFAHDFPEAWNIISRQEQDQFQSKSGFFTFQTIYPLANETAEGGIKSRHYSEGYENYHWKLISYVPLSALRGQIISFLSRLLLFSLLGLVGAGIISWFLARAVIIRTMAEKALKEREEQYLSLVETMNDGLFLTDNQDRLVYVNSRLCQITGYDRDELINESVLNFLSPDQLKPYYEKSVDKKKRTNEPFEITASTKQGNPLVLRVSPSIIFDEEGIYRGGLGIVADITRQKQVEEDLREQATFFNHNPAPVLKADYNGKVISYNPIAAETLKRNLDEESIFSIFSGFKDSDAEKLTETKNFQFEENIGEETYLFTVNKSCAGECLLLYGTDITRRKIFEKEIRKLSAAVGQCENVIIITDVTGKIVFANKANEKSSGYSREELIGKNPSILKTGHTPPEAYKDLWKTIEAGGVWRGEFLNKRKDGSTYWEEGIITPIKDEKGKIVNYLAVKVDVTGRKAAEEELEKAKEEAEIANRLKSEFLANMSHEIRTPMNAILGFTDILLDDEHDSGRAEKLAIIRKSGRNLLDLINDILDFSKIEAGKVEIQKINFKLRRMLDHIGRMFGAKAKEKNLAFRVRVADSVPKVVQADDQRINQILLNVLGNAFKFTKSGSVEVDCGYREGAATIIIKDTGIGIPEEKLAGIFSVFEQADSSTERKYGGTGLGLAISKKLAEAMGGTITVASKLGKGSTFTIELPLPETDGVPVEPGETYQFETEGRADQNEGERMVKRWLRRTKGDELLKSIVLEGIQKLPERLGRLEDAVLRNIKNDIKFIAHDIKASAGNLGLSDIHDKAREIEEEARSEHYDTDRVKNLFFDLKENVEKIPAKYLEAKPAPEKYLDKIASQYSILVAEDNEINQKLVAAMLKKLQLKCDIAENGRVALDKLKSRHYDLLLLDMQMPVMDGIETIKHIRADEKVKNLYIIALTAHAMKGDAEKYTSMGCNDYISKPIDKEQFQEKIKSQMVRNYLSRHEEEPAN